MRYDFDKDKMVETIQHPLAVRVKLALQTADGKFHEVGAVGFEFAPTYTGNARLAEALGMIVQGYAQQLIVGLDPQGIERQLTTIGLEHVHDYVNMGPDTIRSGGKDVWKCLGCPSIRIL